MVVHLGNHAKGAISKCKTDADHGSIHTYIHTPSIQLPPSNITKPLQLGPHPRLLQDGLHLGRLHHVALDLEGATHEQLLGVRLAAHQIAKVLVAQDESDVGLLGRLALADGARLLEVDVVRSDVTRCVLDVEGEDGVALLDRVLSARGVGFQRRSNSVEGGGGRVRVWEKRRPSARYAR